MKHIIGKKEVRLILAIVISGNLIACVSNDPHITTTEQKKEIFADTLKGKEIVITDDGKEINKKTEKNENKDVKNEKNKIEKTPQSTKNQTKQAAENKKSTQKNTTQKLSKQSSTSNIKDSEKTSYKENISIKYKNGLSDSQIRSLQKNFPQKNLPNNPRKRSEFYLSDIETEILKYINMERTKAGLSTLSWEENMRPIARWKSNNMLQYDYFSHPTPCLNGDGPMELAISYFGYYTVSYGENLYMGIGYDEGKPAKEIVDEWMKSPGHKANILNKKWHKMSAGVVRSGDKIFVTQHFSTN